MLDMWLGGISRAEFIATYFGRAAFARPSVVADPLALFGWRDLAEVLASGAAECFVVAAGEIVDTAAPTTHQGVIDLLRLGAGLFVRRAEHAHARLAQLAASIPGARVQIFVTPGATHGFRWHYDDEHVFVLQTAGIKDYYLRVNTLAADLPAHPSVFSRIERETSALHVATLAPGDFLYVPARWWHMAESRQTSLSLSIGVSRDLHRLGS
jgi:50S ribosomal protein L16 3-hydroxylase